MRGWYLPLTRRNAAEGRGHVGVGLFQIRQCTSGALDGEPQMQLVMLRDQEERGDKSQIQWLTMNLWFHCIE
jgi:hypothetical protein